MKRFMKKSLAIFLTLMMLSGSFMCLAAVELNEDAVKAHYGQYKNYVLLGDSVASGYRDEMSDDDAHNNDLYMDSTYCRYEGSYADVLADAIIADDGSMTALAGPGFRTIELRYMLEDDYAEACEDPYLFWPSHLYVYKNQVCTCHGEKMLPGSEHFRDLFKDSIASADLITLGIGGNDWGAYFGWVLTKMFAEKNIGDEYAEMLQEVLAENDLGIESIEKVLEIAHLAGALPAIAAAIPEIINYGLGNFYMNWDYMIQDIYDLNPDVTLMVLGMSDNSLKGKNYDYNGVEGAPVEGDEIPEAVQPVLEMVVDAIMTIGNTPMIEGAKKFGYTYVDTDGTTYVESHPDADGHKYYNAIEYVLVNNIMSVTSEGKFSPDANLTNGQLAEALNAINGTTKSTSDTTETTAIQLAMALFSAGAKKGITGIFNAFSVFYKVLVGAKFNIAANVTRAEAAHYFKAVCEF